MQVRHPDARAAAPWRHARHQWQARAACVHLLRAEGDVAAPLSTRWVTAAVAGGGDPAPFRSHVA